MKAQEPSKDEFKAKDPTVDVESPYFKKTPWLNQEQIDQTISIRWQRDRSGVYITNDVFPSGSTTITVDWVWFEPRIIEIIAQVETTGNIINSHWYYNNWTDYSLSTTGDDSVPYMQNQDWPYIIQLYNNVSGLYTRATVSAIWADGFDLNFTDSNDSCNVIIKCYS